MYGLGSGPSKISAARSSRTMGATGRNDSRPFTAFNRSTLSARPGWASRRRCPSARGPYSLRPWPAGDAVGGQDLRGDGAVTNGLVAQLGSRHTAGFHPPGEPCPAAGRHIPYPTAGPERERLLALTDALGLPACGMHPSFPVTAADRDAFERLGVSTRLRPGAYACVHPAGRAVARRWPPERFAAVADALGRRGLRAR
jgi:hypothetical protein